MVLASHSFSTQTILILFALATTQLLTISQAHNWLVYPHTYNTNWLTKSCEKAECKAACPRILQQKNMLHTRENPAAVWRRGQTVKVCYARNNHHGGFARFSLVPVNVMNSREWHDRFTLLHTCFGAGATRCRRVRNVNKQPSLKYDPPCGTDSSQVYCRKIKVPDMLPDGDYVLGHVWYGGVDFKLRFGQFADYYSCSFIRIKGGSQYTCDSKSSKSAYKPYFDGDTVTPNGRRNMKDGKCLSSVRRIGPCDRFGCPKRKPYFSTPALFNGKGPEGFRCRHVWNAFDTTDSTELNILKGICKADVCCPKECGVCGGPKCDKRGLGPKCCSGAIRKTKKYCDEHMPPCIRKLR